MFLRDGGFEVRLITELGTRPKPRIGERVARLAGGVGVIAACSLLAGTNVAGCATLPSQPAERGLYIDLRSVVELSQDTGWVADREELEVSAKDALRSVCQVEALRRMQLDAWLSDQITREGGAPERVYREHDGDLSAASRVLVLARTQTLLRYVNRRATTDCPFWLTPRADFQGVRGAAGRFVLLVESQAFGALVLKPGDTAFGFGAGIRALVGNGLDPRLTLAVGGELGASSAIAKRDQGRRLEASLTGAIPVLLRVTRFSRTFDFEIAPVFSLLPSSSLLPPGVRFAIGAGTAMRSFPGVRYGVLWLGYEYHPVTSRALFDHSVQIGTRIGIN